MKVGIIGDFHYPDRSRKIDDWIWERLSSCSLILSSGDFTSKEILDRLSSITSVAAVRGNMDFLDLPSRKKLVIRGWQFGIFHGSGVHPRGDLNQLYEIAHSMDVDIFVHGHTHKLDIQVFRGILFLNPGSACGVWSGGGIKTYPSMIICSIGQEVVAESVQDNLTMKRVIFQKKGGKVPEGFRAQE